MTSVCEGDELDQQLANTAPLPDSVLEAIMNTEEGKQAREVAQADGEPLRPTSVLKGIKVHLSSSSENVDYLVVGFGPMSGADNTWFWLLEKSRSRTNILLFEGGNCIEIRPTKTLGYRDVVTRWAAASTAVTLTFKFDSYSYKMVGKKSQSIN